MRTDALIPHLFRTESGRITSVLCRHFGVQQMDLVEDVLSETFLAALETWPYNGLPENPVGWLHRVAKNKAKNRLKHDQIFYRKIAPALKRSRAGTEEPDIDLSEENIGDSQLRMLFAVSLPAIPPESQIALALRLLCGFGIQEIATAFLLSNSAVSKRLVRAKEILKKQDTILEIPAGEELASRLGTVLKTIYLLFNEGYYSESHNTVMREELSLEAMRLNNLLLKQKSTDTPEANALMALMCFHASRFPARRDRHGGLILYADQDESLWNRGLIGKGTYYFKEASGGNRFSRYHLEAGIAYWHTVKTDSKEKWEQVLQLYNRLLQVEYSPVAALNRTFVLAKVQGEAAGIAAAEKLQLIQNPYYFILLGELYSQADQRKAADHYQQALGLSKTDSEKRIIEKKIAEL